MQIKNIFARPAQWPVQIIKKLFTVGELSMPRTSKDERFIKKAIEIIRQEIHNSNFGPDECARLMMISRAHLNRRFKKLTGKRTSEFIRSLRLKKAAELLEQRSGSVSEIAFQVGFNHLSYFARIFREQFGQKPSEYAESTEKK